MLGQVPWPSFQTELFLETPHRWHELLLKQALLRMFFGIGWLNPNPFRIGSLYYIYVYLSRFGLWNNQATQWQSDIPNSEGRRLSDGVAKKRKGFCPTCECASCRRQRLNSNKKKLAKLHFVQPRSLKISFQFKHRSGYIQLSPGFVYWIAEIWCLLLVWFDALIFCTHQTFEGLASREVGASTGHQSKWMIVSTAGGYKYTASYMQWKMSWLGKGKMKPYQAILIFRILRLMYPKE